MYAITIEPLNTMVFLLDRPIGDEWDVEEGVQLDVPMNYDDWLEGTPPPEHLLCRSTSDGKAYKIFRYRAEVDPAEFQPTGRTFGGVLSKSTWERFVKTLPIMLANLAIPDEEPSESGDEVVRGGSRER